MIVLLIALWSLSAIYFTHLLSKKGMKVAAGVVTALYAYVILWATLVFVIDIADLGFSTTQTRESLIFGSDIYHAITGLAARMYELPADLLVAIVMVSLLVAGSAFTVILVGGFRMTREICKLAKHSYAKILMVYKERTNSVRHLHGNVPLIKLYCRANC